MTEPFETEEEGVRREEIKVDGSQLVDKVKELLHEGNVRRIVIKMMARTCWSSVDAGRGGRGFRAGFGGSGCLRHWRPIARSIERIVDKP